MKVFTENLFPYLFKSSYIILVIVQTSDTYPQRKQNLPYFRLDPTADLFWKNLLLCKKDCQRHISNWIFKREIDSGILTHLLKNIELHIRFICDAGMKICTFLHNAAIVILYNLTRCIHTC